MRRALLLIALVGVLSIAGCMAPAPPATPPASIASPAPTPTAQPPSPTPSDTQLIGRPLNGGGAPVYRLMPDGTIRHLSDWLTFISYGYLPQDVVTVSPERLKTFPLAAPLTRWVTGFDDRNLYLLYYGKRYLVTSQQTLAETGGAPHAVSQIPDSVLNAYPLADGFPAYVLPADPNPHPTAAAWYDGALWVGDSKGSLTRWDADGYKDAQIVPDHWGDALSGLITDDRSLIMRFDAGPTLRWTASRKDAIANNFDWIGRLIVPSHDPPGLWWMAGVSSYISGDGYRLGSALWQFNPNQPGDLLSPDFKYYGPLQSPDLDPSRRVSALLLDPGRDALWAGTDGGGLLLFDQKARTWRRWTTFDSDLPDNTITGLALAPDGDLWLATSQGLVQRKGKSFTLVLDAGSVESVAISPDGAVWAAGPDLIARVGADGSVQKFTPFDSPQFLDAFHTVVLDDAGQPWFAGAKRLLHFDGQTWSSFDFATHARSIFDPNGSTTPGPETFPDPTADYASWLQAWPRPAGDNGLCIHYLQLPSGDDFEARAQIARMQALHLRWVLVNYNGPSQLLELAPIFRQAGIMGVWRPHVRPDDPYTGQWARDVKFLRSVGIAPYIQVYNEPSLDQEWDGKPVSQSTYLDSLGPAVKEVYGAGGYVGLQQIDPAWLRASLQRLKADGLSYTFDRLFFVPHPYGFNHPPDYVEDSNGVLGFREYARVFQEEIGYVPPMIAGEGGWRPGEAQDARFPMVDAGLHRDYIMAVFSWFSTGRLSDGQPLPDYLFAYCPWLLSDPVDPAAWFDSRSGDLSQTIQAVTAIPAYRRRFSWDVP